MKNVRMSFPQLWTPKGMVDEDTGKTSSEAYSGAFIFPKDHPQLDELLEVIRKVAQDKWTGTDKDTGRPLWELMVEDFMRDNKLPFHDGDRKRRFAGYAGNYYISARNKYMPLVVNRDPYVRDEMGKPIWDEATGGYLPNLVTEASRIIYSGCYVNVRLEIWAQNNKYGQRINAGLKGVQFRAKGDAFTGGTPSGAGDFEEPDLSVETQEGAASAYARAAAVREAALREAEASPAQARMAAHQAQAADIFKTRVADKVAAPRAPADPLAAFRKASSPAADQKAPDPRGETTQALTREQLLAKLRELDPSFKPITISLEDALG